MQELLRVSAITLVIEAVIGGISIYLLGEYGYALFVILPFVIGALPVLIHNQRFYFNKRAAIKVGLFVLLLSTIFLLVFALEGMICILMSLPIIAGITIMGSLMAYLVVKKKVSDKSAMIGIAILSLGSLSFDTIYEADDVLYSATTAVEIDANINKVWNGVVTFEKLEEPTELIFKTGVAYPISATIQGSGVGAIRYCNFTTGPFVEPITVWDEPNLLAFSVTSFPEPMEEFNPFWEIHPPHLDSYFASERGQFKLTKINENRTLLEGTTWYQVDIDPQFYWKAWSDIVIHKIHERVLNHIKIEAEK